MFEITRKPSWWVFKARRVNPGGVFKTFTPLRAGQVIDCDFATDVQIIEFEPYSDHKSALDTLRGI